MKAGNTVLSPPIWRGKVVGVKDTGSTWDVEEMKYFTCAICDETKYLDNSRGMLQKAAYHCYSTNTTVCVNCACPERFSALPL